MSKVTRKVNSNDVYDEFLTNTNSQNWCIGVDDTDQSYNISTGTDLTTSKALSILPSKAISITGAAASNFTTSSGALTLDGTGGVSLEAGGTSGITLDSSGNVTKIGQSSAVDSYVLKWDGTNSKVVWDVPTSIVIQDDTSSNDRPIVFHDNNNNLGDDTGSFFYNPGNSRMTVETSGTTGPEILLKNTNADADGGVLRFTKDSAIPAISDELGKIDFYGKDNATNSQSFASIIATTLGINDGNERGKLDFKVATGDNGTEKSIMNIEGSITDAAASTVTVAGNIDCGTLTSNEHIVTSDRKLKKNIITIDNPLEKVNKMRGVYFDWKNKKKFNKKKQIGFIAQEVEEVVPELVSKGQKNIKAVNYAQTVALLLEAVKEQNKMVENQNKMVEELRNDIEELRNDIEELKNDKKKKSKKNKKDKKIKEKD